MYVNTSTMETEMLCYAGYHWAYGNDSWRTKSLWKLYQERIQSITIDSFIMNIVYNTESLTMWNLKPE